MNVLCLSYEYPPIGGGGSTTIHEVNRRLTNDVDLEVLTTGFRGAPAYEVLDGVPVSRLSAGRADRFVASFASMAAYALSATVNGIGRARAADLLHCYFVLPTGIPAYHLANFSGKPLVVTVFGGDLYDPTKYTHVRRLLNSTLSRRILRRADAVTTISRDLQDRIRDVAGIEAELIHCGVDTDAITPPKKKADRETLKEKLRLDPAKTHVLSVGRLIARKNYPLLIEAFAAIAAEHPDADLVIVGEGPQHAALTALAAKLGVADRVHLAGFVDADTLVDLYRAADVFAMASLHEGQCCTILEAMAAGAPVVATDAGGIPDSVVAEETGLLVPPGNTKAFAAALAALLADAKKRKKMGRASRERTVDVFDWQRIAGQTKILYERLVYSR